MDNFLNTGYIYDPVFLKHDQSYHPECAKRLEVILNGLKTSDILKFLHQFPCRTATQDELEYVHTTQYINQVKEICEKGGGNLDPDTYTTSFTYDAAAIAVGSLIDLTIAVIGGKLKNGFALVRPPGHHALANRAMGFCIFSNVAIAAKAALMKDGIERVAIVDFDVHHGNGTQAVLEENSRILYISSHLFPYYPGTGNMEEIGSGEGKGTTINLPLAAGVGDEGFKAIYSEILTPVLRRFQPQMIFVSAGYDCHWDDPLANLSLSLEGLFWISQTLVNLAGELCDGRIIFALEGGYNLQVLSLGVANSIKALLGRVDFSDPIGKSQRPEPDLTDYIVAIKKIHGLND